MLETTPSSQSAKVVSHAAAWEALADRIRNFDADIIILVARKMPRLMDALHLDFGRNATCISDQAIAFVQRELKNARVAIVDDVWNVGTTMLRAREKVQAANPRTIRLFALGAKNAEEARNSGVGLIMPESLTGDQYKSLVDSVPRALKLMAKPYDVDFPVVPCLLRAPFQTWDDCWSWLKSRFGDYVHSTTDADQLSAGFGRASINSPKEGAWTVKARLYFDFKNYACSVVPFGLAPTLPLENDYPVGSMAGAVFDGLSEALRENSDAVRDNSQSFLNALARVNTFCDSLLFTDAVLASLDGLVQRGTLSPFSLEEVSMQFGPSAARSCERCFDSEFRSINRGEIQSYIRHRPSLPLPESCGLLADERIVGSAIRFLREGLPIHALEALFADLGRAVGADDPSGYVLESPYTKQQIDRDPYLRLRLGFTFEEIVNLFRSELNNQWVGMCAVDLLVSALLDAFIDDGAVVPTFTLHTGRSVRIYRKGEANPRWDEEMGRLKFAISLLNEKDRKELMGRGRTRIAKLNAILSMSSAADDSSLAPGSLERGTVGALRRSVVERQGGELTGVMRRLGLWN